MLSVVRKIKYHIIIDEIDLTARDWQLYSSMPESEEAANALNTTLKDFLAAGSDRRTVEKAMMQTMRKFSHTGACDSEPLWVLDDLMNYFFGRPDLE